MKKKLKTLAEACADSNAQTAKWLEERNRREEGIANALPDQIPVLTRDQTDLAGHILGAGQEIIVLGYRKEDVTKKGSTYVFWGYGAELARTQNVVGNNVNEYVHNFIEKLRAQGVHPRAIFWGLSGAQNKELEREMRELTSSFSSSDIPYAGKEAIIRKMDKLFTGKTQTSGMQYGLEELFTGRVDEGTLEKLVGDVDAEVEKVALDTGSIGVVRFNSNGNIGYGKVSSDKPALQNEHNALRALNGDGIAKVLAPVPIGLATDERFGALFTWGTENKSLYNEQDVKNYFSTFNSLLYSYAQSRNLNLAKLARDPKVQEVFNMALIHTSLNQFDSTHERPSIMTLAELEQRAKVNKIALKMLRKFNPTYAEASKRIKGLDLGEKVFIHGDARRENIGKDPYGVKPFVDWANAKMGYAVEDLSSLGAINTREHADWYNFVMNFRESEPLRKEAKDSLVCFDVTQPYRTASFKIGKGRIQEAQKDIRRLERNALIYKEYFS